MNQKILMPLLFALLLFSCDKHEHAAADNESHTHADTTAVYVSSDEGKEWNIHGVTITGKILSEQSNGEYSVIITETPPQSGPPRHVHSHEDELFYVLKGTYEFYCGDEIIEAKEGDFVRLPKGIPHGFINTDTLPGITMNTITPGGFEGYFNEMAELASNNALSKPKIDSLAQKYGMKFIEK
ncbi:cupin domain-containing protein [Flammeovirgaceae bacterium SG7u.111]|nr:cupin domain-containing protein [Flammeovirgaceae bacterium SG7u.132]WPO35115.1 cupin domain-containing protein [Flammeovirgaceae bacterium SG7u.111]